MKRHEFSRQTRREALRRAGSGNVGARHLRGRGEPLRASAWQALRCSAEQRRRVRSLPAAGQRRGKRHARELRRLLQDLPQLENRALRHSGARERQADQRSAPGHHAIIVALVRDQSQRPLQETDERPDRGANLMNDEEIGALVGKIQERRAKDESGLLPCPHCGKTRWLTVMPYREEDYADGTLVDYGFVVICSAKGMYSVGEEGTRGCGSSGGWGEDEAEAVERWNRRASDMSVSGEKANTSEERVNPDLNALPPPAPAGFAEGIEAAAKWCEAQAGETITPERQSYDEESGISWTVPAGRTYHTLDPRKAASAIRALPTPPGGTNG